MKPMSEKSRQLIAKFKQLCPQLVNDTLTFYNEPSERLFHEKINISWLFYHHILLPFNPDSELDDTIRLLFDEISIVVNLYDIDLLTNYPNYDPICLKMNKLFLEIAAAKCDANSLYMEFKKSPNKHNEEQITQFYQTTIAKVEKKRKNLGYYVLAGNTGTYEAMSDDIHDLKYRWKLFVARMKEATSRLVDTYLGLLPLRLDVWTVLFIVSQLPEFDLVYDGAKVRIYERMRLFRDKCSAKVTVQ